MRSRRLPASNLYGAIDISYVRPTTVCCLVMWNFEVSLECCGAKRKWTSKDNWQNKKNSNNERKEANADLTY